MSYHLRKVPDIQEDERGTKVGTGKDRQNGTDTERHRTRSDTQGIHRVVLSEQVQEQEREEEMRLNKEKRDEIARLTDAINRSKSPYLKRDYKKRIERIRNGK